MKIAYVCADRGVPVFGCKGCSIHVQEVVRALVNQGHQVTLFAARLGGEAPTDLAQVPVHRLPKVPQHDPVQREQAEMAANLDLRFALETAGPFDLVYERYSLWSVSGMEYGRDRTIPSILEVNAPLLQEQAQYRQLIHTEQAQRMAQRVFATATALVAVSEDVATYLGTFPQAEGRVHVIPNGVNVDRFHPTPPSQNGRTAVRPYTIGFLGTMKTWHGLPILAEAFTQLHRHCPQARLSMIGDGPARPAMEQTLKERGLGAAVTWHGRVSPQQIPRLLAAVDVAVAPYPQLENFYFSPLKVYEYMAAGLPVVASDLGQLRQIIRPGIDGLLCPPGDAAALADRLRQLEAQPRLRQRLGRAARQTVVEHHSWDRRVREILAVAQRDSVQRAVG
ncbi:glycosyltransferase family 4 protein [Leptolyngbya sp. KIOST-1]|uniref:glycosyltransferase family 4 protein n=1 Tax=Leptolyngbya sp. KIOST-1 TaxID=1229172 RepID=UPI00055AFEEC|nr:glycosyltransferase family 4 protein [Leptolyngbya sp. KIOST-1]